jgi:hypothetical protein
MNYFFSFVFMTILQQLGTISANFATDIYGYKLAIYPLLI